MLMGILREWDSIATRILIELNVNIPKLYNEIIKVIITKKLLLEVYLDQVVLRQR